jgi:hypothetical protein
LLGAKGGEHTTRDMGARRSRRKEEEEGLARKCYGRLRSCVGPFWDGWSVELTCQKRVEYRYCI